jgi:hypothetical protein
MILQHDRIAYDGFMTAVLDHATLASVEDEIARELAEAADAVEKGPARLRAAILKAADAGERPAAIHRAINFVYTYDYVARLVREHRGPSKPGTTRRRES